MSSLVPPGDHCFYSRKEKSLGVLCSNFLKLYNRDGVDSIGLDDAANRLGVERRRIYDIVNILESVGVLSKKAKNQYFWRGFGGIPKALDMLKEEALNENLSTSSSCLSDYNVSHDYLYEGLPTSGKDKPSASCKVDSRKEKSLGLLTQNFIKLFISSKADLMTLDYIAKALLGDIHDPTAMRNNSAAKVRRLYDIANVFSSINLIEKTHHPESRKPAFRWLGLEGSPKDGPVTALKFNEIKKRVFGTEITNSLPKKYKKESSLDWNSNKKADTPVLMRCNNLIDEHDRNSLLQPRKHTSNGFVFGPFTPASVADLGHSENKNVRQVQDLEDLASPYGPRYRNQAWKSWYVEAAEKKHIQKGSILNS
ncbi:E2F transcription factor-like E2FF isoform X3 [Rhododendron vialii]|uniref:E2F transcription factor-like E2FF isoform X3 n=1 Tax=Rhododendron vialii TaxID=182163 RepID=UPI00265FE55E|nr:E2F transcription factor-like E2FF isoform X3 [Rhododendron vialii]